MYAGCRFEGLTYADGQILLEQEKACEDCRCSVSESNALFKPLIKFTIMASCFIFVWVLVVFLERRGSV